MQSSALVQTLLLGAALALPASGLAQSDEFATNRCKVEEVATYQNRVHVRCNEQVYGAYWPRYFASPTSSSSESTRLVTLGSAALTGAGDLLITYEVLETDAQSYGCDESDCRRPLEIRPVK